MTKVYVNPRMRELQQRLTSSPEKESGSIGSSRSASSRNSNLCKNGPKILEGESQPEMTLRLAVPHKKKTHDIAVMTVNGEARTVV